MRKILTQAIIDDLTNADSVAEVESLLAELPDEPELAAKVFLHKDFDALIKRTISTIESLSVIKGGEYAAEGDRLDNFRRAGNELGLPMEAVWRVYAGKHWDSISTFVRDLNQGISRPRSEPISGRADDLIVYLILFKAMLIERGIK